MVKDETPYEKQEKMGENKPVYYSSDVQRTKRTSSDITWCSQSIQERLRKTKLRAAELAQKK